MTKKYISEKELSAMTGRALQTLRNDRFNGRGFPYIKLGKSVRYDREVVACPPERGPEVCYMVLTNFIKEAGYAQERLSTRRNHF